MRPRESKSRKKTKSLQKQGSSSVLGSLPVARFLREHWQKKPLLVRNAFPEFRDCITPEELAGLACEEGVESRLVREMKKQKKKPWEVTWGPQDEKIFAKLPERDWTLLVQEVNRWVPEVAMMLEPFSFLPNVRVDDVMVSYAVTGGSVGPHVDSYDVFLVQGRGERRWRFHDRLSRDRTSSYGSLVGNIDLRVLSRFDDPDVDEVLRPGDMLYLPPGFAHHGVAVTSQCMTYSIGFRAPSAAEAWMSYASFVASSSAPHSTTRERIKAARLLEDPPLTPAKNPGAIPPQLLVRARQMIRSIDTSNETIDRWFASFTSQLKPGHDLEGPTKPPKWDAILREITRTDRDDIYVVRSEECRWIYLDNGRYLYLAGNEIDVSSATALTRLLCSARRHPASALRKHIRTLDERTLLHHLFVIGALRFARRSGPSSRRP